MWLWVLIGILALFLIIVVACSALTVSAVNSVSQSVQSVEASASAETTVPDNPSDAPTEKATPKSNLTPEQQDAVGAAEDYLSFAGFSKQGLIKQLSSDAGSGFSKKDAQKAVDSMNIDWNKQAARSAKSYRETMHFSRDGLVRQLESDAGSGYTHDQAVYGADHSR